MTKDQEVALNSDLGRRLSEITQIHTDAEYDKALRLSNSIHHAEAAGLHITDKVDALWIKLSDSIQRFEENI